MCRTGMLGGPSVSTAGSGLAAAADRTEAESSGLYRVKTTLREKGTHNTTVLARHPASSELVPLDTTLCTAGLKQLGQLLRHEAHPHPAPTPLSRGAQERCPCTSALLPTPWVHPLFNMLFWAPRALPGPMCVHCDPRSQVHHCLWGPGYRGPGAPGGTSAGAVSSGCQRGQGPC